MSTFHNSPASFTAAAQAYLVCQQVSEHVLMEYVYLQ